MVTPLFTHWNSICPYSNTPSPITIEATPYHPIPRGTNHPNTISGRIRIFSIFAKFLDHQQDKFWEPCKILAWSLRNEYPRSGRGSCTCWRVWLPHTGIILAMGSANERRHYNVRLSLIGQTYTQNDPCLIWLGIFFKIFYFWLQCVQIQNKHFMKLHQSNTYKVCIGFWWLDTLCTLTSTATMLTDPSTRSQFFNS